MNLVPASSRSLGAVNPIQECPSEIWFVIVNTSGPERGDPGILFDLRLPHHPFETPLPVHLPFHFHRMGISRIHHYLSNMIHMEREFLMMATDGQDRSKKGHNGSRDQSIVQEDLHVDKKEDSPNLCGTQPFLADHSTSPLMKIGPKLCILKTRE